MRASRCSATTTSPPAEHHRRFALLLYLDRSRGRADLLQREEMAGPAGELFARYMAACRGREQTARCSGGGGAAGEA